MKCMLIGIQEINYKQKDTGNPKKMAILHCTRTDDRCLGVMTEQVRIYSGQTCYSDAVNLPIDHEILVDYNQRGMVDSVEVI